MTFAVILFCIVLEDNSYLVIGNPIQFMHNIKLFSGFAPTLIDK